MKKEMSSAMFAGALILALSITAFFVYNFFYNDGSADSADAPAPQQELSVVEKASVVQQLNDERPEKPVLPPPPSGKTTVSPQQADPADPEAAAKIHILQGLNAE